MKDILLPYRVCDARYPSGAACDGNGESSYQRLFATNEQREGIAAAKDSDSGAFLESLFSEKQR